MKTAVEFYAEGLENLQYNPLEKNGYDNAKQRLLEQAKKIEKEQTIDFANDCLAKNDCFLDTDQYYNETFKQEEQ